MIKNSYKLRKFKFVAMSKSTSGINEKSKMVLSEMMYNYLSGDGLYSINKDLEKMTPKERFNAMMTAAPYLFAKPKQEVGVEFMEIGKITITGEEEEKDGEED